MTREEYFYGAHGIDIEKAKQAKTGWIPVSERLPDKYTYTLWCASSGYVRSDYFNGEFWEDAKKYCYEVIAWMPLPEPYVPDTNIGEMSENPTGSDDELYSDCIDAFKEYALGRK